MWYMAEAMIMGKIVGYCFSYDYETQPVTADKEWETLYEILRTMDTEDIIHSSFRRRIRNLVEGPDYETDCVGVALSSAKPGENVEIRPAVGLVFSNRTLRDVKVGDLMLRDMSGWVFPSKNFHSDFTILTRTTPADFMPTGGL